jgi:hypothetical protein
VKLKSNAEWERMSTAEKIALCEAVKRQYPDYHPQIDKIEAQIREMGKGK